MTEFASVEASVREELEQLGVERVSPALAASALALAREMDDPGNSATSKSMCGRSLLETMKRLREMAPPAERKDQVDELKQRRSRRRRGGTAA